mgnify:CR=1 FL=1
MLALHTFTHRCVTAGSIISPKDYLVYPRREGYALLEGWQVLLRRLLSKKLRHDFLSLNAGVYPTRSSLQITGLQNELLAQYYNVTNLKHELVLGLRTQFFDSLCPHS